jgi:hypothetical protein
MIRQGQIICRFRDLKDVLSISLTMSCLPLERATLMTSHLLQEQTDYSPEGDRS